MKRPAYEPDLPWETWGEGTAQDLRGKALCDVGREAKVGVGLIELPVNCHTRPARYHTEEEERLYALSGSGTLRLGGEVQAQAGFLRVFPGRTYPPASPGEFQDGAPALSDDR